MPDSLKVNKAAFDAVLGKLLSANAQGDDKP
jgi:hypothetical protein